MAPVVSIRDWPRPVVLTCETLLFAACYYAAGRLGLSQQLSADGAVVSPFWPPTGLAVAGLLIYGVRCLPGIALGALLVVASLTVPGLPALAVVVGSTLAPLLAWQMLRMVGFRQNLSRLRDGLSLVFLAALVAMLISSGVGIGMLVATDRLGSDDVWLIWLAWWVGDAMGVVLVTPLVLLLHRARWPPPTSRWAEALALTAAVCVLIPVVTYSSLSLLFLVYPILIWAAIRFQLVGGISCALFASVLATAAAREGRGSFVGMSEVAAMMKLQAFNGTLGLTALLLSALITEQLNTRRSVEEACHELIEALQHLNTEGSENAGTPESDKR
ncbi:MASE1 domain-containing protein [Streptomyces sp. NPDC000983]|uniref:MASE1 domain-containing protein n=1 Tax=Streptomyces sp. NPDC000983 TaxID=3154373 RepID=UPI00332DF069